MPSGNLFTTCRNADKLTDTSRPPVPPDILASSPHMPHALPPIACSSGDRGQEGEHHAWAGMLPWASQSLLDSVCRQTGTSEGGNCPGGACQGRGAECSTGTSLATLSLTLHRTHVPRAAHMPLPPHYCPAVHTVSHGGWSGGCQGEHLARLLGPGQLWGHGVGVGSCGGWGGMHSCG